MCVYYKNYNCFLSTIEKKVKRDGDKESRRKKVRKEVEG